MSKIDKEGIMEYSPNFTDKEMMRIDEKRSTKDMSLTGYKPIGIIHSPFKDTKGMPIQPAGARYWI
ncbi:MAG: hypothetical protein AB1414_19725 [bacterium]